MLKYWSLLICIGVVSSSAWGQGPRERRMPNDRLELIRLWWLVDELQIDEEQATHLFPVWSRHHHQRRELQQRRQRAAEELAELLKQEDTEEEALKKQIEQVRGLDKEKEDLTRQFHNSMAELLTVRQQARLVLFDDGFRKDLQELIRAFRQFRRSRDGPPGRRFRGQEESW